MARKFRKKPGLGILSLPGMAGLGNDDIVEGDEYARFCPAVLEEVFDSPKVKKEKPAPPPPPPPVEKVKEVPSKPEKVKPEPEEVVEESEEEEEVEPPNINWLKSELTDYAEGLGLTVDKTMTKAQILEAIEKEEASE